MRRGKTRTLGAMNNRAALLTIGMSVASAAGCDARSDFLVVEPVRYEPPSSSAAINAASSWVRTTADKAERFKVRVGLKTYQRIIEPNSSAQYPTLEQQMSAFSAFAEAEVVRKGLCVATSTPDPRLLFVTNNPVEFWIYVRCV
jgi:hypothetical protein